MMQVIQPNLDLAFQENFEPVMLSKILKVVMVLMIVSIIGGCVAQSAHRPPIKPWNYYKWRGITRQTFDYSCGAAALATLLSSYFGFETNENTIMLAIVHGLTEEELKDRVENGFSMLDIQKAAKKIGFLAEGVTLGLDAISKLKGPIMIILKTEDFEHFVILKGADQQQVYLADPSRGNIRMSLYEFDKQWDGSALIFGRNGMGLLPFHGLQVNGSDKLHPERDALRQMSPAYSIRNR